MFFCRPKTSVNSSIKKRNVATNNLVKYKCNQCSSYWDSIFDIENHHSLQHSDIELEWYECKICEFLTCSAQVFEIHCAAHNKDEVILHPVENDANPYQDIMKPNTGKRRLTIHTCDFCLYETRRTYSLKRHIAAMHKIENIFKCSECPYQATSDVTLKKHETIHSKRKILYNCEICAYETNTKYNYTRHKRTHEEKKIGSYSCDKCSYKTKVKQHLSRHCKNMHANDKKLVVYNCEMCSYKTTKPVMLKKHQIKHPPAYKCTECPFSAELKEEVRKHVIETHLNEDIM